MDEAVYSATPAGFSPHRIGGHVRHVVDFYECFLSGLESTRVDYDQRTRELLVETHPKAASAKIHFLIRRFEDNPYLQTDSRLAVRMETSILPEWIPSSVSRELQALSSHTIHHFALIAMTMKLHGLQVDASFGMSPSTLRHVVQTEIAA